MRAKVISLAGLIVCFAIALSAVAQEGHPLKGTWLGDWGPNKNDRNQVTIVMDWDGKQISGQINPGPNAIPLKNATLEPKGWAVHFEADAKNAAGQPVHYVVDGKMENLGSAYSRVITGTWKTGAQVGNLKVVRN